MGFNSGFKGLTDTNQNGNKIVAGDYPSKTHA